MHGKTRAAGYSEKGRFNRIILSVMVPKASLSLALTVVGAVLLVVVFGLGIKYTPTAYVSYVLSAYLLVSWIMRAVRAFPSQRVSDLLHRNRHIARVIDDSHHRKGLTTMGSSLIEFLWVAANAVSAVRTGSSWFVTLAAYYGALAIMRLMLAPFILKGAKAPVEQRELRLCCFAGAVLGLCAIVFAGMVVLVTHHEGSFSYSEYMLYLVALYAFYSVIGGVMQVVKAHRSARPSVFAANAVSLVTAGVSMLSLAVAMIDRFGSGDEAFRMMMVCSIGAAVCALSIGLGIWVVVRSRRASQS